MSSPTPAPAPSVEVRVQPERKIIRVHFRRRVSAADVRREVDTYESLLQQLGPGFILVTDLSELEEMELESFRDVTRIMDLSLAHGVKQVVRVIPDPDKDIGFHLLSLTHYRGRVRVTVCATAAEAEELLAATAVD